MNKLNVFITIVALFLSVAIQAQVKFKMSYNNESELYTISLIPMATYEYPQNITGTGQITIKVPSNRFEAVEVNSHLEGISWDANSRNDSPEEDRNSDYISFGLNMTGVAYPEYKEGVEMPLFSFKNAYGCTGIVALVDNETDVFMAPNSESANIGNTLTIFGAGGDAYSGIIGNPAADCEQQATTATAADEALAMTGYKIFPNPAVDFVNVEVNWEADAADANLMVLDATGKIVINENITLQNGTTTKRLNVTNLPSGNYMVYLQGADWKLSLNKMIKG